MKPALPPSPRAPGIVQLFKFATQPFDFFDRCAASLGDPFTVDMAMFGKFVLVSAPALVKQVFTGDPDVFQAGKANRDLEPFVGPRSLLLLDGAEHLRRRRLLMPPFHGERMRTYTDVMADRTRAAVAQMPTGEPFAMQPFMQAITLEIILRAVFGFEHGEEKDRMFDALVAYLEPPSPLLMFLPLVDLPLTPYRAFLRRRNAVDKEIFALLEARRAGRHAAKDDILTLLLSARDEAGTPLTDSELRDELMTLLIAGHETTATALTWTFERLLAHPEVLERVTAELASCESAEAIVKAEYLDAVIRESLRMRPIFPDVVRELQAPAVIGDWELPAGTRVAPCIHLAHYREDTWPEARTFRPERFLGAKIDPFAWFPFGGGVRRCVGMAFALHEMKIVLGTMLREVRLRLADERPVRAARRGVIMGASGGLRVVRC